MSPSAKERLTFLYKVVADLRLGGKSDSLPDIVAQCCGYLEALKGPVRWQNEICEAMLNVLADEQSREAMDERLNAILLHAAAHPDRASVVANFVRRALLGELGKGDSAVGLRNFSEQMDRMYAGNLNPDDVWVHAWQRLATRLKLTQSEAP
jgi:hypothetical protein